MAQLVDWDLAAATAATLSKSGPGVSFEEAAQAVEDLRRFTQDAEDHVAAFTEMGTDVVHPPVRVVDRRAWSAANIEGMRHVVAPLTDRLSSGGKPGTIMNAVGSRFTGAQIGTVLGYLSGRVLGQYDVFSSAAGRLLLVAPNIVDVERRLGADPAQFRLWVCLHEVTHRTQFTAVPWLRAHFLNEVNAFVEATELDSDQILERIRRAITILAEAIRDTGSRASLLDLVQTPAQRAVLDRLTTLMTLLEGHAEYVMDGVGPQVVPSVEQLRASFNRRRIHANPLERALRKVLGVDAKLRQYTEGRSFVQNVVEQVGMAGFNQVWQSPRALPRTSELADPAAWVARVRG